VELSPPQIQKEITRMREIAVPTGSFGRLLLLNLQVQQQAEGRIKKGGSGLNSHACENYLKALKKQNFTRFEGSCGALSPLRGSFLTTAHRTDTRQKEHGGEAKCSSPTGEGKIESAPPER